MNKKILILLTTFLLSINSATYSMTVARTPLITQGRVLFVTHASEEWDLSRSIETTIFEVMSSYLEKNPTNNANNLNIGKEDKIFFLVDDEESIEKYFWTDFFYQEIQKIESYGGRHSIEIGDVKEVFITGGVFNQCSCRTVIDIISKHYSKYESELHLYFVTDAIYLNRMLTSVEYSAINLSGLDESISLKNAIDRLDEPENIAQFIDVIYFSNGSLCKATSEHNITQDNFKFNLYLGKNEFLASFGNSEASTVHFHYIDLDGFKSMVNR